MLYHNRIVLCALAILIAGCRSLPILDQSSNHLQINLDKTALFIELGAGEELTTAINLSESFRFVPCKTGSEICYNLIGFGSFKIRDNFCNYDGSTLTCNSRSLDLSYGGLLFRENGQVLPVNPLTLFAK